MNAKNLLLILALAFSVVGCQSTDGGRGLISPEQLGEPLAIQRGTVLEARDVVLAGRKTRLGQKAGWIGAAAGTGVGGGGTETLVAVAAGYLIGEIVGAATEELVTRRAAQELRIELERGDTIVLHHADKVRYAPGDVVSILQRRDGRCLIAN